MSIPFLAKRHDDWRFATQSIFCVLIFAYIFNVMTQHFLHIKIKVYSVLVVFVHLQVKHYLQYIHEQIEIVLNFRQ